MTGIEHATLGLLLLALAVITPVVVLMRRALRGEDLYVRRIPAIDAFDEATGRAAELGRPMSFTTSNTDVGPVLYACLGVLYYVARKAAQYKTKLLLPQKSAEVMAISEDTLRDAYRDEGKLASFDSRNVLYLSEEQFAFAAGYIGLIQRERVATAFLFGFFAAEALLLAEAGQQVGAMQIAASISPEQVAFFVCTCDYTLIGEELFAASAYLTREPIQLGTLCGQDRAKLLFLVLIVVGVGIATYNSVTGSVIPNIEYFLLMKFW